MSVEIEPATVLALQPIDGENFGCRCGNCDGGLFGMTYNRVDDCLLSGCVECGTIGFVLKLPAGSQLFPRGGKVS